MQPLEVEQRARQFSTLVAVDVPAGTSIGIDCMVWLTGEKFSGVKMIPPGFHLVTSAVSDAHGGTSPRSGFFLWVALQEVIVRKFQSSDECFADERAVTYDEQKHWEHGVRSLLLDDKLAAYANEKWLLWRQLTNCIDSKFASKLCDGQVRFFAGGHEGGSSQLQLSHVPRFMSSPSNDPQSVTAECLDPSPVLRHMVHTLGASTVLAELQLAFVLFIFCEDLDGLEHWKRLVHLACRSETFLLANQEFLFNFIQVFKRQLQNVPADLFQDVISCENFLRPSLRALIAAMDSSSTSLDPALLKRLVHLTPCASCNLMQHSGAANSRDSWRRGSACPSTASSSKSHHQACCARILRILWLTRYCRAHEQSDDEQPTVVDWSDCAAALQDHLDA
jgi:A1 cistron-splicing factor AAR2